MRKNMPELAAIPLVLIGFGVAAILMWAADAGLAAWLVVGAVALAAFVVLLVIATRRPRGVVASGGSASFDAAAPPREDGVHRVLVVTAGACTAGDLAALTAPNGGNATSVLVVAPALSSRLDRWTGDEHAYAQAQQVLDTNVAALTRLGVEASGHIGSHDPIQAADDGLREFPADEVVFVLHQGDDETWLEQGVVDIARGRYAVPVREVVAD